MKGEWRGNGVADQKDDSMKALCMLDILSSQGSPSQLPLLFGVLRTVIMTVGDKQSASKCGETRARAFGIADSLKGAISQDPGPVSFLSRSCSPLVYL